MVPSVVRHAVRRLALSRGFALAAVLTLALGIGATTSVLTLVDAVLLRPLPYPEPERLVDVSHELSLSGLTRVDQSDATYLYYRRANRVFTDLALYQPSAAQIGGVGGAGGTARPERTVASRVTASLFQVLGAQPLRGRAFVDAEDLPQAPGVVLIGEDLWRRRYGADPALVGKRVDVDGVPREVVGIMPASFAFPSSATQVWLPLTVDATHTRSAAFDYAGVARLRDGVTPYAAAAELRRLLPHVPDVFPGRLTRAGIEATKMRPIVRPLREVIVGDIGRVLWVVLAAVAFVLLIACANVVNLFLVRAEGRQLELAVRRALGASRASIAREFLAEGFILSAAGGILGVVLAAVAIRAATGTRATLNIPRLAEVGVDARMLGVAVAITVLAALVVSVFPALRSAAHSEAGALSQVGRTATAGRHRHRARHTLVVVQVALALVLLAGAGLMARSFAHLRAVQPGFDAAHAFTFRVTLLDARYRTAGDAARFIERVLQSVSHVPGAQAAGAVTKLPLDDAARADTAVWVEEHLPPPGAIPGIHQVAFASPDYFRALGIPLLQGRSFEDLDATRAPREVVVTKAFAGRYFPGALAVGKRIRMMPFGDWYTIVGVTGDVRATALEEPPDEMVYLPLVITPGGVDTARFTPRDLAIVVSGRAAPRQMAGSIQNAMHSLDPQMGTYAARPMTDVVSRAEARTRMTMLLLGVASLVALALGAVGIYGVVSYVVSLRAREIAVRIALGAEPASVRRMVSRQAIVMAATGVVIGLAGAVAVTRVLGAMLFGVGPTDPVALAGSAALLLTVSFAASWLPARRAAGVDPARVLRGD
ncbi:MAG TPA: ABC transporter permease [Gemmatimonadaceae bacterium]